MIRRSSVTKDEAMSSPNRHLHYQSVKRWSKDNRYDLFSILTKKAPKLEIYNITVPDYVEITYECMGWTAYTEQLNEIVQSLNWASEEYWGDKKKYKFLSKVSDYNIINELDDANQRVNRVECSITVKAYLLPESFDGERTTKKGFSSNKIVFTNELDFTANGRNEGLLDANYDSNDITAFISLNTNISETPVTNNTITFAGIKMIMIPKTLNEVVPSSLTYEGVNYDVKIYINGNRYTQNTDFNITYSNNSLTINFISGSIGFNVTPSDAVTIAGRFTNVV